MTTPRISNIRRHNGVAGQFSYTVDTRYPGEEVTKTEFVGSTYGGGVVLVMNGKQVSVRPSGRFTDFSTLNPQWVRDFFKDGTDD